MKNIMLSIAAGAALFTAPAMAATTPVSTAFGHNSASALAIDVNAGAVARDRDDYRRYGYSDYDRRGYDRGEYRRGDRYDRYDRYDRNDRRVRRGDYVRADTRVWRGRDNRYYCSRSDGTTGLLIGGAAGAVLGSEVAGRGDRTLGALLGGLGGALLGRSIDRSDDYRCR